MFDLQKDLNCKIETTHYRQVYGGMIVPQYLIRQQGYSVEPRGGKTVVTIVKGINKFTGIAECSLEDNYCKKEGRDLAIYRALISMFKYYVNN